MADLRERIRRMETGPAPSNQKRQLALMNSLDMAHRRISFILETDIGAPNRVSALEEVLKKVPGTSNYLINHFRTGPRSGVLHPVHRLG
eukprot:13919204-Alexandrium_andersonii.AAC.1